MTKETAAAMRALSFMAGDWAIDYTVTQRGNTTRPLRGTGSIRYLFDGVYLAFDYQTKDRDTEKDQGGAHGIFAWDAKAGLYRYHWFESSGSFLQATGVLRDEHTLALEWQGIDCTQIFQRVSAGAMYLEMECPSQDLLLRVDFDRLIPAEAR